MIATAVKMKNTLILFGTGDSHMCHYAFRKLAILLGWVLFALVAYKTSQVELDFSEFDPFGELGIDRVSRLNLSYTIVLFDHQI